ncbi:MAG: ISAs1 family transposase [Deltaproteobacteria bacterium]|jgi:hypothetical protein|nr:ISAs1 family transposase [Deltaproteobacteria bacterium]
MLKAILNVFSSIPDYRVLGRTKYALTEILFIVFIGVLAGCHGWKEIREYTDFSFLFLKKCLPNLVDIPSVDTLARTISKLDPKMLNFGFLRMAKAFVKLSPKTQKKPGRPPKGHTNVISLDGKTARGAVARGELKSKVHIVNAVFNLLTLAVEKVRDKSNEITAFPVILEALASQGFVERGSVITVDAWGAKNR